MIFLPLFVDIIEANASARAFSAFISPVRAHSGDSLSAWASIVPTIDGTISSGEWTDAVTESIILTTWEGSETHHCTLYVKNDVTNLYLAIIVRDDDYSGPQLWGDSALFWFDNDHDGLTANSGEVGDDAWQLGVIENFIPLDLFLYIFPEGGISWQQDEFGGGTNDLSAAYSHSNPILGQIGDYVFEFADPLDTSDDGHDFSISLGDTVGFIFYYVDYYAGGDFGSQTTWPSGSEGDIVIAHAVASGNLSITGRVYYSTHPLDCVKVNLFQGSYSDPLSSNPLYSTSTIDGYYNFTGLTAGTYTLTAYGSTSDYAGTATWYDLVLSSNVTKDFYLPKVILLHNFTNEANISSLQPTFSWDAINEASRYNVQINILNGSQLGQKVESAIFYTSNYTMRTKLTPGVKYWIHVGASDTLNNQVGTTYWSIFTVVNPEHDLSVSIDPPEKVFSSTIIVNATVQNLGQYNESTIIVQFFVNRGLAASKTIPFLQNASSITLGFPWASSSMLGTYNLTVYIIPLLNENLLVNNMAMSFIHATPIIHYISCSVLPSDVSKGGSLTVFGAISLKVSNQSITLTYTNPDGLMFNRTIMCGPDGSYTESFNPDMVGSWSVSVSWSGNTTHIGATSTDTFTVSDSEAFFSLLTTIMLIVLIVLLSFGLIYILTREH
ncbi:MAG: hypothetical protein QG670_1876 [Thermoproteota archaeon]|nr:hypothetical protein [Thermoproteota archaeon]